MEQILIYVRLLDEGTDVVRPTSALLLDSGEYELLPTPDYDASNEHWEFPPGTTVELVKTITGGEIISLATSPAKAS